MYVKYVLRHYDPQRTTIVLDGYSGPSTKDECHLRRSTEAGASVEMTSDDQTQKMSKKLFLANTRNKSNFLEGLGKWLAESKYKVVQSPADADLLIAQTAIGLAELHSVVVVAEDTDVFVLLLHYLNVNKHHDIYFQTKKALLSLSDVNSSLTPFVKKSLLFIHAISGCDTTSRPYGIGKTSAKDKAENLYEHAQVFMNYLSDREAIEESGQKSLSILYKIPVGASLALERATKFSSKVAKRSEYLPPENLPPTEASAKLHSARVFLQVQAWLGNITLNPNEWGYELEGGHLRAVRMVNPAAPEYLLKVIRCNSKTTCSTLSCTCMKHGIKCSLACGNCKGICCSNPSQSDDSQSVGCENIQDNDHDDA